MCSESKLFGINCCFSVRGNTITWFSKIGFQVRRQTGSYEGMAVVWEIKRSQFFFFFLF